MKNTDRVLLLAILSRFPNVMKCVVVAVGALLLLGMILPVFDH